MSTVDLSSISSALATIFEDRIVSQFNRSVVLSQLLPYAGSYGKNLSWDAEMGDGLPGSSTISDGADVSTYNNDTIVPATLNWGVYSEAFQVTGLALSAARATGNPAELAALFAEKIDRAVTRLAKNIGKDIYNGTGSNSIIGLTGTNSGLEATGTYASINRSTYSDWAGNKLANGGTPRALTLTLMRDMRKTIYNACGEMPDLIVGDASQHEAYGNLLSTNRRYMQEVYLRGQKIILDGGYRALDFDGIPVMADVNAPSGQLLFINSRYVKIRQLADTVDGAVGPDQHQGGMVRLHGTAEEQLGQTMTGLVARINPLARTGDSFKFQLVLYPQLQVTRPNASGILADLS
jgi:hypothetical protein